MSKKKKTFHGFCIWPDCPERGVYFTGRRIGTECKWGYACRTHQRLIAKENVEREQEEAFYRRQRPAV